FPCPSYAIRRKSVPLPSCTNLRPSGDPSSLSTADHPVYQAVLDRLLRREEEVAVGVSLDSLQRLPGVFGDEVVQLTFDADDLARVDLEVAGLAAQTASSDQRLVHVYCRIGQRQAPAFGAGHDQHGPAAGPAANT